MAIDDPLDQELTIGEHEAGQKDPGLSGLIAASPYLKPIVDLVTFVFTGNPFPAVVSIAEGVRQATDQRALENSKYLIEVVISELRYLNRKVSELGEEHRDFLKSDEHQKFLSTEWVELWVDADRKAKQTRSRSRVERIGKILFGAAREFPSPESDHVEEMMRIATLLDDADVTVLREAVRVQGRTVSGGRTPSVLDARTAWRSGKWRSIGVTNVDSVCDKLASLGLLRRIDQPSSQNDLGPIANDFVLSQRAIDFVKCIRPQSES